MSLRYCPVLVATLVFTAGCQRSTTVVALPPPKVVKPPVDELAETVQEAVKKASDVAACRRLIEQVNAALARPDAPRRPDPLGTSQREFLAKDFALTPAELTEVSRIEFTPLDAYYLDECFLLRDAVNALDVKHLPKPDQARYALDWVARNVRTSAGGVALPLQFMLLRGAGTPLERCYTLLALAAQLELDACLLADPDGKAPDFGVWGVGILDGGKLYVFDPRLGMPLTTPDGKAATLADLRSGDAQKALAVDPQLPYDVTPERAKASIALITASVGSQSPRMKFLESLLPAGGGRLTVDLPGLQERFRAAGIEAKLWNPPAAESYARLLSAFLPKQEGGTDAAEAGRRRIESFVMGSVPWNLMPPFLAELGGEAGGKVRAAFAERTTMLTQPGSARDLILRGNFGDATEQLVALRARLAKRPHSDQELARLAKEWADDMRKAYAELMRLERAAKTDPTAAANVVAVRDRMETLWRDSRFTWMYMEAIASGPLTAEATYLQALAKHEQAERLTHRSETAGDKDSWQSAIEWWRTYLGSYSTSSIAPTAKRNLALALAASGRGAEAKVAFDQLQTSDLPPLEKLACKVRAAAIK